MPSSEVSNETLGRETGAQSGRWKGARSGDRRVADCRRAFVSPMRPRLRTVGLNLSPK
jgi:hypothetical protein